MCVRGSLLCVIIFKLIVITVQLLIIKCLIKPRAHSHAESLCKVSRTVLHHVRASHTCSKNPVYCLIYNIAVIMYDSTHILR